MASNEAIYSGRARDAGNGYVKLFNFYASARHISADVSDDERQRMLARFRRRVCVQGIQHGNMVEETDGLTDSITIPIQQSCAEYVTYGRDTRRTHSIKITEDNATLIYTHTEITPAPSLHDSMFDFPFFTSQMKMVTVIE